MKKHLAVLALALPAVAQASVSVQTLSPVANSTYVMTEDALPIFGGSQSEWSGPKLFLSAQYNFLDNPLVQYDTDRTQRTAVLIDGINTLDLTAAAWVRPDLQLGVTLPLDLESTVGQPQFALGDTRVFGKVRLTKDDSFLAISLIPELSLPTGSQDLLLSSGTVGFGIRAAFEHDFGALIASANVGMRYNPGAQYMDIDYRQQIPLALGVYIPIDRRWGINTEAAGAISLPVNSYNNPSELYAGARFQASSDVSVTGGVSLGSIMNFQGAGEVRAVLGIRFSPMPAPKAVVQAPAKPAPVAVVAQAKPVVQKAAPAKVARKAAAKSYHEKRYYSKTVVKRTTQNVAQASRSSSTKRSSSSIAKHSSKSSSSSVRKTIASKKRSAAVGVRRASSHKSLKLVHKRKPRLVTASRLSPNYSTTVETTTTTTEISEDSADHLHSTASHSLDAGSLAPTAPAQR